LLILKNDHCLREETLNVWERGSARFEAHFEADQIASIFKLIYAGFGVSILPEMARRAAGGCHLIAIDPQATRRVGYVKRELAVIRGRLARLLIGPQPVTRGSLNRAVSSGVSIAMGCSILPPFLTTAPAVFHVVHNHVDQQPRSATRMAAKHIRSAHLTGGVIKRRAPVAALACLSSERLQVKISGACNIIGWKFEIANFAVLLRVFTLSQLPQCGAPRPGARHVTKAFRGAPPPATRSYHS